MFDVFLDCVIDTLKILPFLFLAYLAMEAIEQKMSDRMTDALGSARRYGPLIGAAAGIVPQCGFSATAASFYAGGVISTGTLLAVFLSTSDEMLPVYLSTGMGIGKIGQILLIKVLCAVITGFAVDRFLLWKNRGKRGEVRIHELCEEAHCGCDDDPEGGIWKPAAKHTFRTLWFIFLITLVAAYLIHFIGEDTLTVFLTGRPVLGVFATALVGLIPNCAASVVISTLYTEGLLTFAQMMAGLLVSAGVGLLVLFRTRSDWRENLRTAALLYCAGAAWGLIFTALPVGL